MSEATEIDHDRSSPHWSKHTSLGNTVHQSYKAKSFSCYACKGAQYLTLGVAANLHWNNGQVHHTYVLCAIHLQGLYEPLFWSIAKGTNSQARVHHATIRFWQHRAGTCSVWGPKNE